MIIFAVEDFEVEPLDENFRKRLYHAFLKLLLINWGGLLDGHSVRIPHEAVY